ncbi:MAG: hypothetical protein KDA41_21140, partial [Planctomycetales bacterium]|nr:hypothetical protein [Planctomycetales bacterium]
MNRLDPAIDVLRIAFGACRLSALAMMLCSGAAHAQAPITAAAFSPDGQQVVVGSQQGVAVVAWPSLKPLRTLPTEMAHVHHVAFSPAGDRLAAAGGSPGESGELEIFRWPDGARVAHARWGEDV